VPHLQVRCVHLSLKRWDAHHEPAVLFQPAGQLGQRCGIVLDVLQDFEGTHEIEASGGGEILKTLHHIGRADTMCRDGP